MNNPPVADEVSIADIFLRIRGIFYFLVRKWVLIVLISLICLAAGVLYAQLKQPQYVADTSFTLDEEKSSGSTGLLGLAASFGLDVGGGGSLFTNQNILQLFTSRKIVDVSLLSPMGDTKLTHAQWLVDHSPVSKKLNLGSNFYPRGVEVKKLSRLQDSVLTLLYKRTVTDLFHVEKPDKKVDIYHVIVKSPDERFSSSFSKTIVSEVSKLYTLIKTTKSKQTVDILQRRVDSLRGSYTRALYGQAAILDANINPALRSVTVGAQQKQAEITTSSAAYQELLKNLEMSKYALLKQSPLFQIIDEPRFPLEKKKPSRLIYGLIAGIVGGILTILILLIRRFLSTL
jgi:LPS O-antigen subunit length determinant protein (WzzB/FepE family)